MQRVCFKSNLSVKSNRQNVNDIDVDDGDVDDVDVHADDGDGEAGSALGL